MYTRNQILLGIVLGLSPEILIAFVYASQSYDGYEISKFFQCIIFLYVIYFLIWLRNTIISSISHALTKKQRITSLVEEFKKYELPKPSDWIPNSDEYFLELKDDINAKTEQRVYAGIILGMLEEKRLSMKYIDIFRTNRILTRAFQRYIGAYQFSDQNN